MKSETWNIKIIFAMIKDKDEITQLALYSTIKDSELIALIDEKLLSYYV